MSRPKRSDVTVKIAGTVYRKAKTVAAYRNVTLAEYLSNLLDKPVGNDYSKMLKAAAGQDEDEKDA